MKFPVSDFTLLTERLAEWHAQAKSPLDEADHYFNAPDRDFARTDEALRLRRIGPMNIATYKVPKEPGPTKTRTEIEVPLQPGAETAETFCRFLTHLGYRAVAVVRKRRVPYSLQRDGFDLEVCLDDVVGLGLFAEVEIVTPESEKERAQAVLQRVAGEMGLQNSERRSYLELLLSKT